MWNSLELDENKLVRLNRKLQMAPFEGERKVLLLPRSLVKEAIFTTHKQLAHRAAKEVCNKLQLHCYFPNMMATIIRVLTFCIECQTKTNRLPDQRHTLFSAPPGYPWQILSLDFVVPFTPSKPEGYVYLFTIKDTFTKWIEAFPIKKTTTLSVLKILQDQIFSRFGKCE